MSRSNSEDDPSRYLLEDAVPDENAETVAEIEDISGPSSGCSSSCRARAGAGRYRCDSEQRDYNSSLLERYNVPPARDALDEAHVEDFDAVKHTILLICLCCSMFVGEYLNKRSKKKGGYFLHFISHRYFHLLMDFSDGENDWYLH